MIRIAMTAALLAACNGSGPDTSDPTQECEAPEVYAEPGCDGDTGFATLDEAGCYTSCTGELDDSCPTGTECVEAWTNPCICAEGEDCCDACGGNQWLCL